MNWLLETLTEPSMIQAVAVISIVAAVGVYLGRLKIFGISLGITFVFFAGIMAGHLGITVNKDMLNFAQNFGLIVFVYTLGLQVGPGFFSSLKKGGVLFLSILLTRSLRFGSSFIQLVVGYQVVDVLFVAPNQTFFQHPAYLADLVEITSPDVGIGDSPRYPQALQGLFAYFQERADLVAVHPHIFFTLFCLFYMIEYVIGNGSNFVVQFLVGFGLECYYFHNGN